VIGSKISPPATAGGASTRTSTRYPTTPSAVPGPRSAISTLGGASFEDYLERPGGTDVRIEVEVTLGDEEVVVDFAGTDEQVDGPLNAVRPLTLSCVYFVAKAVVDPSGPTNDGVYRPVTVRTPAGSMVDADFPAATGVANAVTCQRIVDVLLGAFGKLVPRQVTAASSGTMNGVTVGGTNPDRGGESYSYVETYGGGQGAMPDLDGMDGVHTNMTNTRNAPVEVLENTYPFTIERYEFVEDSEGAGRHRGGVGITRELRLERPATVAIRSGRERRAPWGVAGGNDASGTEIELVDPDGSVELLPTKHVRDVAAGARLVVRTAGGGGWGPPRERERFARMSRTASSPRSAPSPSTASTMTP
jgi:N-methylhydantoinase B